MKQAVRQRGAWDVPANYVKVAFNVSSSSDHTETTAMGGVGCPREELVVFAAQL